MIRCVILIMIFLGLITASPKCYAVSTNCRRVGDQIYCDTQDEQHSGGLLSRFLGWNQQKKQLKLESEMATKQLEAQQPIIQQQADLMRAQTAAQEEQRKNLEIERKIKEEQLKQLQLQNAQMEAQKK